MASLSQASSLTPCGSPASIQIPVQPDHFYNSNNVQLPLSPGQPWLDPADDPLAQRGIPVFKPTMEEFQDFEGYMDKIECWGSRSGIVKVIPPQEWTDALPVIKDQLAEVKIKSPIEQHMFGDRGLFRQQNMEKRKWMSVREWAELCTKEDFRAPGVHEVGLASRHGPVVPKARNTRRGKRKVDPVLADGDLTATFTPKVKDEPIDGIATLDEVDAARCAPTPPRSEASPPAAAARSTSRKGKGKANKEVKEEPKPRPKRVHPTREAREASLADRAARDRAFVEVFDPSSDWLPPGTTTEDYNFEFCQQLERRFWRGLGLGGKPAWYGADTQGSLFTDTTTSWNVAHLPSALSRLLPSSSKGLPGVNTPYLYFGMWRATFAWHVEDMDLFSINYIHFGAPKFWYAIPQGRASGLEQAMRNHFPKDTSQCSQFLRHKSFLASPSVLAKDSCKPNCLVQRAGEFVITYPRGYHAGFNLGFNCAESVNFALNSWIEMGRRAKACECVSDSVRIDVDELLRQREEEREELLEASENEATSPPPDVSRKREVDESSFFLPPRAPKRKGNTVGGSPKPKKVKINGSPSKTATSVASSKPQPKISVTLKLGPRPEDSDSFPCCLCVSTSRDGLLRVQDPPIHRKDIIEAAGNPKIWMAHEFCASIVPETWVDVSIRRDGSTEKVIYGVGAIVKDRWNLKCSACSRSRPKAHGAPVQCTKGKCPKAFHVNCAIDGASQGVLFSILRDVDKEVVLLNNHHPPSDRFSAASSSNMAVDSGSLRTQEAFKVVKKLEVQVLCTQHNPVVAAQKKASKQDRIRNELLSLPSMSRIKIRVSAGVFEVSLIRVMEETGTVEVLWDQNTRKEFKWGSVVFGSTDVPVQHKPTDSAGTSERLTNILPTTSNAPMPSSSTSQPTYPPSAPIQAAQPVSLNSQALTPQLYASSNRISYSQLAGSFGYGQWAYAANALPYGSVPQAYPYVGFYGPVAPFPPATQPQMTFGQMNYGQADGSQTRQPISSTDGQQSTTSNPLPPPSGEPPHKTEGLGTHSTSFPVTVPSSAPAASSSGSSSSSPSSLSSNVGTDVSPSPVMSQEDFGAALQRLNSTGANIHSTQLAEILQSNPQLATMLWAAIGHPQTTGGA